MLGLGLGITYLRNPSIAAQVMPPVTPQPGNPISEMYGTGAGQVQIHHVFSAAQVNALGQLVSSVNAGGAGAVFDLAPGSTAIPVMEGHLDLLPTMHLRFTNTTMATRPNLIGTRLFMVADLRGLVADQYLMGNGSPHVNLWIRDGGATLRLNRRNPTTNSFETVSIPLSPAISGARHIYEFEITANRITLFVDGKQRGSAAHIYPELTVLDLAAGQNPANGNGVNAWLSEVLLIAQGGNYEANVEIIRQRLAQVYQVTT